MLKFNKVTKIFNSDLFTKDFYAVKDLSFELTKGSVVGFLGANGAGKTTSLKMAMDFIRPTQGEISFSEEMGKSKNEILSNIGFLPERPYLYPHLNGRDFCNYMGKLSGLSTAVIQAQIHLWAPVFKIDFALDRKLRGYSKGMLQRIGFLVTLLHDPKLIILDEPLSGLDPIGRKELKDVILKVKESGKTIFFSSHIISDVEEVCDEVIFIKNGSLYYQGSVQDIIKKHSKNSFRISYMENKEFKYKDIPEEAKNSFLSELLEKKLEILSVNQDKPTLEEIIYEIKS